MTLKDAAKSMVTSGEEVKIPEWWQRGAKTNPNRNMTDVQQERRRAFAPDMSFDLDGDGIVGNRDLVLSKLFDKDGDGKLNALERKNAEEAIKNGIDSKMVWNVEQSGVQRSFRIMQKRGVVLDADDFLPIRSTYPEHPLSKVTPNVGTQEQLQNRRRESNCKKIEVANQIAEERRQRYTSVEKKPYILSEFSKNENMRFTSVNQRKEFDRQQARKKVDLTDTIHD